MTGFLISYMLWMWKDLCSYMISHFSLRSLLASQLQELHPRYLPFSLLRSYAQPSRINWSLYAVTAEASTHYRYFFTTASQHRQSIKSFRFWCQVKRAELMVTGHLLQVFRLLIVQIKKQKRMAQIKTVKRSNSWMRISALKLSKIYLPSHWQRILMKNGIRQRKKKVKNGIRWRKTNGSVVNRIQYEITCWRRIMIWINIGKDRCVLALKRFANAFEKYSNYFTRSTVGWVSNQVRYR